MVQSYAINKNQVLSKQSNKSAIKRHFIEYFIVSVLCALINILFYDNPIVSYGLILVEIIILASTLFNRRYDKFIIYYTIFLSLCLEFSNFVGSENFINIKNVRILGVNLGVWVAIPTIIVFFLKFKEISKIKKQYNKFWTIGKCLILLNIIAFIVGLFFILINNNNIQSMENYFSVFLEEAYGYAFFPIFFFSVFSLCITYNPNKVKNIALSMQAILFACVIQRVIAILFSIEGQYGGHQISLCSVVCSFSTFLIVFVIYPKEVLYPKLSFAVGMIGILMDLLSGSGGKGIILIVACLIIIEIKLISSSKPIHKLFGAVFPIVGILVFSTILNVILKSNGSLGWKLYNVQKLFSFGPNWLENLPHSPKVRAGEFINIFLEFVKNPLLIITGKGFMGTVLDYSNIWQNALVSYDAFTDAEWSVGAFYSMHEISSIILTFGLLGVWLIIKYLKLCLKHFQKSVWIVIGFYWLLIYYGFSFTIGAFGGCVFFFSLYEIDAKKELKL